MSKVHWERWKASSEFLTKSRGRTQFFPVAEYLMVASYGCVFFRGGTTRICSPTCRQTHGFRHNGYGNDTKLAWVPIYWYLAVFADRCNCCLGFNSGRSHGVAGIYTRGSAVVLGLGLILGLSLVQSGQLNVNADIVSFAFGLFKAGFGCVWTCTGYCRVDLVG